MCSAGFGLVKMLRIEQRQNKAKKKSGIKHTKRGNKNKH